MRRSTFLHCSQRHVVQQCYVVCLVTLLGSVSFGKMSENKHGLIRYTYVHFTLPKPSHVGNSPPRRHKTEALHVTHILSNSPMVAAVLFLCNLSTTSPSHVPTLSVFSFCSSTVNTSFSLQITMHVENRYSVLFFYYHALSPNYNIIDYH